MNSRFKFRVWDRLIGKLSYFDLRGASGHLPVDIPDEHIQQCTGVADCNGKDVYEGDIVQFDNSEWSTRTLRGVGEVVFCRDFLLVETPGYSIWFHDGLHLGMGGRFEVIGNSFENPDILRTGGVDGEEGDIS